MVASATYRSLTPQQEFFARLVAEGKSHAESYRIAFKSKGSINSVKSNAYKVAIRPEVEAKIAEFKAKAEERMVLTRSRKRHILYEIAEAKRNRTGDRIKAIEVDNRMTGDEAPVKIEGDVTLGLVLGSLMQSTLVPEKLAQPVNEPITLPEAEEVLPSSPPEKVTGDTEQSVASLPPAIPSPLPHSVAPTGPLDTPAPKPPLKRLATSREYDDE